MNITSHVEQIRKQLEGLDNAWMQDCEEPEHASAVDYLSDALDIEYIVNGKGEYLGARVLVAFGGPNIWINTRTNQIEGSWWNEISTVTYQDNLGINEVLEEFWNCK